MLSIRSDGLVMELFDFKAENATLNGDYLRQVVEIVIGGVPTFLEIHFMRLFMSRSRIQLRGSVLANLFDQVQHQGDLSTVDVSIYSLKTSMLWLISFHEGFILHHGFGTRPSLNICLIVFLSHLHELYSLHIGFGFHLNTGMPN
jgi:hypothetical protein